MGDPLGLCTPPKHPPRWPGGPPSFDLSPFFCLLCLKNYSKIFQKCRISNLSPEDTYVAYPLGGAPPGSLEPPKGSQGVLEVWKNCNNSQKLYKIFTCRKIPEILTLTPVLGYLGTLEGPHGSKIFKGVVGHSHPG